MRTTVIRSAWILSAILLGAPLACSSSSGGTGGTSGSSGTAGSGGTSGAGGAKGTGAGGTSGTSGGCSGSEVPLTVKNFEAWCQFEIDGAHTSRGTSETVCVAPGTVKLSATALPGFVLGTDPWHDTTTATGASATVKVSAATCVWVCCPGTDGSAPCPTADQCP